MKFGKKKWRVRENKEHETRGIGGAGLLFAEATVQWSCRQQWFRVADLTIDSGMVVSRTLIGQNEEEKKKNSVLFYYYFFVSKQLY